jgi:hypothetical protein
VCQIADPTRHGKYAVTVRTILRFPDHHLRATAQRVVVFDEDLCSLATDLLDTLRAASAIGITGSLATSSFCRAWRQTHSLAAA